MPGHDASGCGHRGLAVFGRRRPEARRAPARVLRSPCGERSPRPRLEHVRSRARRARSAIRRVVLHRRVDHPDLLPPHLPGQASQVGQRRLLPHCGRRRARGFPPLLAVSARGRARDTGVARRGGDGRARAAAHRAGIPRRRSDGRGPRRHAGYDGPTSSPAVCPACRGFADCGGDDPARAARQSHGRRDRVADVGDCVRRGVCQHPTFQRRVSCGVSAAAYRGAPSAARAWARAEGRRALARSSGGSQASAIESRTAILSLHRTRPGGHSMDLGLQGKHAIVTGGSLGIGKAIARELAREGVDVAIVARTKDQLEATARNWPPRPGGGSSRWWLMSPVRHRWTRWSPRRPRSWAGCISW
jgi:hypothetical protein